MVDPGQILSILGSCQASLLVLNRLKNAYHGDESSLAKLEELEARLSNLKVVLEYIKTIPEFLDDHPKTASELQKTVEACGSLLDDYEHASSKARDAKAYYQIGKLAIVDAGKLDGLHGRLNRHAGDLHLWLTTWSTARLHAVPSESAPSPGASQSHGNISNKMQSPADDGDVRKQGGGPSGAERTALSEKPDRTGTVSTDMTGETLLEDQMEPRAGMSLANMRWLPKPALEEVPSLPWIISDALKIDFGPAPSEAAPYDSSYTTEPPDMQVTPPGNQYAREVNNSVQRPADPGAPSSGAFTGNSRRTSVISNALDVNTHYDASIKSASSGIGGTVRIIVGPGREYVFAADGFAMSQEDPDSWIAEWHADAYTIRHYVPLNNSGIPFTKPSQDYDGKENRLRFMPETAQHRIQLILCDKVQNEFRVRPTYVFSKRRARQKFQEAIRGACKMRSFRGASIRSNLQHEADLGRDVNVKIWTFDDPTRAPTLSFVCNAVQKGPHAGRHEEIPLHCFSDYKDAKKDLSTVILWVRKPDKSLSASPELVPGNSTNGSQSRRQSLLPSSRRHSERVEQTDHSARRSSVNSIATSAEALPMVDLPEGLKKLEFLKIRFDEKSSERARFCESWAEAYRHGHFSPSRKRTQSIALADGCAIATSPYLLPQPHSPTQRAGSLSASPDLFSHMGFFPSPALSPRNSSTWGVGHGETSSPTGGVGLSILEDVAREEEDGETPGFSAPYQRIAL